MLCGTVSVMSASRATVSELANARSWDSRCEASFRRLRTLATVMKALGSFEVPQRLDQKHCKTQEVAEETAAVLASVRVHRAQHLLSDVAARADSLSSLLDQTF